MRLMLPMLPHFVGQTATRTPTSVPGMIVAGNAKAKLINTEVDKHRSKNTMYVTSHGDALEVLKALGGCV